MAMIFQFSLTGLCAMAVAIIFASVFTQGLYAARILKKNGEDGSQAVVQASDFAPGLLLNGPRSALMPTISSAHMEGLPLTQPWSSLHGAVGRRAPSVSMKLPGFLRNLPRSWRRSSKQSEYDLTSSGSSAVDSLKKMQKEEKRSMAVLTPGGVGLTASAFSTNGMDLAFSQEQASEANPETGMTEATWKVKVANMGDSGFVHLRSGEVLFQSSPHPFLLSADKFSDSAAEAQNFELNNVLEGDVFVLTTVGLFADAFADEITSIVRREEKKALSSSSFAKSAANELKLWASQGIYTDPEVRRPTTGGEVDDITVVVVVVGSAEKPIETSGASVSQILGPGSWVLGPESWVLNPGSEIL